MIPEESGAVVFDHDHNGALVDGQERTGSPVFGGIKGVLEAIIAPQFISKGVIEEMQCFH